VEEWGTACAEAVAGWVRLTARCRVGAGKLGKPLSCRRV